MKSPRTKLARYLTGFLLILTAAILIFLLPMLKIATGYSAKMLGSGIFVEGMTVDQVKALELNYFPLNKVGIEVNTAEGFVTASLLGVVSETAYYNEGFGARICPDGCLPISETGSVSHNKSSDVDILLPHPDSIDPNIDIEGLQRYVADHFTEMSKAVVVVKNGQLLAEHYAEGLDPETPILGWSMSKSLMNAIYGILVKNGQLDIHDPAPIEAWQQDERKEISIHNLLQMSSGLDWDESYSNTRPTDATRMLYLENDMFAYASNKEAAAVPDSLFLYSSGTTNILGGIAKRYLPEGQSYHQFIQKELFNKLNMEHSLIECDAKGLPVFSSYAYCSARDWAKFGQLYLNDGIWDGERILPEGWVDYSTSPARKSDGIYGAHFWLNHSKSIMPDMPNDVFMANGYRQQRVIIIPSEQLVLVSLNSSPHALDFNIYLKGLLKYL